MLKFCVTSPQPLRFEDGTPLSPEDLDKIQLFMRYNLDAYQKRTGEENAKRIYPTAK